MKPLDDLLRARDDGRIEIRETLLPDILLRVQQGAVDSIHTRRNVKVAISRTLHG